MSVEIIDLKLNKETISMLRWCCDLEGPLLSPLLVVLAMRGVKGLLRLIKMSKC